MEKLSIPDKKPALSIGAARAEIVFSDDESPLSMISTPLSDMVEMADLSRSCFSLKQVLARAPIFEEVLRQEIGILEKKEERFAESSTYFNRLANMREALGEHELASDAIDKATQLSNIGFFGRKAGEIRARAGHLDLARGIFSRLADGGDFYSTLRIASFYVLDGQLGEAASWVDRAVALNPTAYAGRLFEGALHLVLGNYATAIGYLKMALDDRPRSAHAYCNIGFAYLGLGRLDKAMDSFKRATALDPFNLNAVVSLADLGAILHRDD